MLWAHITKFHGWHEQNCLCARWIVGITVQWLKVLYPSRQQGIWWYGYLNFKIEGTLLIIVIIISHLYVAHSIVTVLVILTLPVQISDRLNMYCGTTLKFVMVLKLTWVSFLRLTERYWTSSTMCLHYKRKLRQSRLSDGEFIGIFWNTISL